MVEKKLSKIDIVVLVSLLPLSFWTAFGLPGLMSGYYLITLVAILLNFGYLRDYLKRCEIQSFSNQKKVLVFLGVLLILFIMMSTLLSMNFEKTIKGLFSVLVLIIMVYKSYFRNINSKTIFVLLNSIIGTVFVLQVLNTLVLLEQIPLPSFIGKIKWPYLIGSYGIFHSNTTGIMIALVFPAIVSMLLISQGKSRFFYSILSFLMIIALINSVSRTAILSVWIFVIVLAGLRYRTFAKVGLGFSLATIGSLSIILNLIPDKFKFMLKFQSGLSGRDVLWAKALELTQKKPLFGIGFKNAPEIYWTDTYLNYHNLYLGMAVELGWLATITFLILIAYYLFIATKKSFQLENKMYQTVAFSLIAGFVSIIIHQFFEQSLLFFGNVYFGDVILIIYLAILNHIIYRSEEFPESNTYK